MSSPSEGAAADGASATAGAGNLRVGPSTIEGAGRGVFATRRVPAGGTVSTCHYVELDTPDHAIETLKDTGVYWWAFVCRDGRKDRMTFALGELTLINHSDAPNVRIVEDRRAQTLSAVALRDIEPGDEIVHEYSNAAEYGFPPRIPPSGGGGPVRRDPRQSPRGRS